ncbi:MAG: FAD-binding protein [Candidatus Hermodarchaeia archaeon]|jgi:electron transfer flavoprotein alpha subunit
MMLTIDTEKCTGCGLCVKVCPFDAMHLINEKAEADEKCTLCGACVKVCPVDAINIERKRVDPSKFIDFKGVWIWAEQINGQLRNVALELLGKGRELADKLGEPLCAVLLGHNVGELPNILAEHGADIVYVSDQELLANYTTDGYTDVFSALIVTEKPNIVLFGATSNGRDLGPRIAARLQLGLTADCTGLDIDDKRQLVQTRPAFGGNIMASILSPYTRPQMATVRPNVFKVPTDAGKKADIRDANIEVNKAAIRTKLVETIVEIEEGALKVDEAEMVVTCGRGIKDPQNIEIVAKLAEELNAALGGSRPIVDQGWMKHHQQVGQSGRTIAPKLYIACGISGAIQHLVGMRTSDTIVAINTDPDAPIHTVSDFSIVGDIFKVVPAIVKELKRVKAQK